MSASSATATATATATAAPTARILSIAGDPASVGLSAHVLAVLEQRTGQPVSALFHLIVGEGAGAALGLLLGLGLDHHRPMKARDIGGLLTRGLHRPRRRWLGLGSWAAPSLTSPKSPLAQADLSAAVTDLAVPVFDMAHGQPFLFRSWKAQGLYPQAGEGRGRYDFRGHDILRAALCHPGQGAAAIRARSRLNFAVAGSGTLARDPVSLASLLARQLYQRAGDVLVVSLNFTAHVPALDRSRRSASRRAAASSAPAALDWAHAGQAALSQLTARGMAERLIALRVPALPANRHNLRSGGEAGFDAALQALLDEEETNGFRGLCREFTAQPAVGHTVLRTPMPLLPASSGDRRRSLRAVGQRKIGYYNT